MTRFSSSRTVLLQVALFGSAIYLIIWSINRFVNDQLDPIRVGFVGLSLIIAILFIYVSYHLYDLKAYKYDIELKSILGKSFRLNINNIRTYDMTSFSLIIIDPLSFIKLTKLKFSDEEKERWVFILNPTKISNNNDIEKVIQSIRTKSIEHMPDKT